MHDTRRTFVGRLLIAAALLWLCASPLSPLQLAFVPGRSAACSRAHALRGLGRFAAPLDLTEDGADAWLAQAASTTFDAGRVRKLVVNRTSNTVSASLETDGDELDLLKKRLLEAQLQNLTDQGGGLLQVPFLSADTMFGQFVDVPNVTVDLVSMAEQFKDMQKALAHLTVLVEGLNNTTKPRRPTR
mmetsp:Transcript_117942/g.333593  ORF Transcript_117942/g.333593 Transcript_117942/m.333593 type:complete len:187 (+) Transcript_117942:72-632(+)